MRRLLLVRHAATPATRAAAFSTDEELDERGLSDAAALLGALPASWDAMSSPALRCTQTATAAGFPDPALDPDLAECDFGEWGGRTLAEIHAAQPEAARAWMNDADAAPHGGESLTVFAERVGGWLDRQAKQHGRAVAITHGGVVKVALVHALGVPVQAFWRLDAAPLAVTELHAHAGRWTVTRVNCAVAPPGRPS